MIRNSLNMISNRFIGTISSSRNRIRCLSSAATSLVNVDVNEKTGVAVVTLNRPPVNSLNLELLTDLSRTLDDLESNKSKGMILTSVGQFYFNETKIYAIHTLCIPKWMFSQAKRSSRLVSTLWRCTTHSRIAVKHFGRLYKMSGWNCMVHLIQQLLQST